ncbi:hypothetical protein TrRE_jg11930, partial [Triparma retinervis]
SLSGYFRVVIDLEQVSGGYVGFCCGTLQDLESIATETEGIVVRCHADNGVVTLLAVRLPNNQFARAELSFRSSDGCVSVTLDGVEVVQFDEGFCIGAELLDVRQFVYGWGKGGVIEGAFQWDKGSWIEELELEIDECIRDKKGKEVSNRLMQQVRDHIDQAERRGGAVAREEVTALCEMGERLGAREISLEEELLRKLMDKPSRDS